MSTSVMSQEAPRHPWLADFERKPVRAVGDLLAGYARVAPYERADAPDKARMLFGPLPADDPARRLLGPAILGWLDQRRRTSPPADRARLQRWVREICEAFEIVYLLEVTDAAVTLRRRYVTWHEWAARLSLSPARDVLSDYWRMLAMTQPLLQRSDLVNPSEGLMPLWLEICRQAGGPLPRHYLEIGLLGLRRMMLVPAGSDAPFLAGLAHWALAQNPRGAEFLAEWLGLKPLYPRTAARWCELVGNLLRTATFQTRGIQAPAWWRGDPDFHRMTRQDFRLKGVPWRSPRREDALAVLNRLEESWPLVEPSIDGLMLRHRDFVERTGNSEFFVRAIHTVGSGLIRLGADAPALKAQALAREGLEWEPYNRYLWSLWRDALAAQGALEAAELVGWEFVRRDPDNVEGRNQLAKLLAETLSGPDQAAALLRDTVATFPQSTVARTQLVNVLIEEMQEPDLAASELLDHIAAFPEDPFPRTQQAELLIAVGRLADAEAVVDAAFNAGAVDAGTYALRARLQFNLGRPLEAAATLGDGLGKFPTNTVLQAHQSILTSGRDLRLQAERNRLYQQRPASVRNEPTPVADAALGEVMRLGRLRRLRFRAESLDAAWRQAALDEVRSILHDDPTFAYAELLAVRFGIADSNEALPNFAVAFEQALTRGDRIRLEELARRHPRLQALTLVARAVLGDDAAAWSIEALLLAPGHDEARSVAIMRRGLQEILAPAKDLPLAVAANANVIRRRLYEAVESMLGDRIAAS